MNFGSYILMFSNNKINCVKHKIIFNKGNYSSCVLRDARPLTSPLWINCEVIMFLWWGASHITRAQFVVVFFIYSVAMLPVNKCYPTTERRDITAFEYKQTSLSIGWDKSQFSKQSEPGSC